MTIDPYVLLRSGQWTWKHQTDPAKEPSRARGIAPICEFHPSGRYRPLNFDLLVRMRSRYRARVGPRLPRTEMREPTRVVSPRERTSRSVHRMCAAVCGTE